MMLKVCAQKSGIATYSRVRLFIHEARRKMRIFCVSCRSAMNFVSDGMKAKRAPKGRGKVIAFWKILYLTPAARADFFGTVEASDADSAIKVAIGKFKVTDSEQQKRLVARRVAR